MAARISLTGRFAVSVADRDGDGQARPLAGGQVRVVFGLLVCERQRVVEREELAHNLWPDRRPTTWKTALRGVVSRVRGFLVDAGLGDRDVIRAEAGTYRLELPADVEIDVERAIADATAAADALSAGDPDRAIEAASRARTVLARPLLPGVPAPWVEVRRRTLARRLVTTLETLSAARLLLGDHEGALAAADEVIAVDPYRESAHRLAIRAHLAAGNVGAGLRAYQRCRDLLADDLGISPSADTQALRTAFGDRAG